MKIAFISVLTSSNDFSRSKMIHLSILVREYGISTEFASFIKPVPALSKAEKMMLSVDYSVLRKAPPLCDITPSIIEVLDHAQTVFWDRFSERIFKKSFKEIGYPMGSATYILENVLKKLRKTKAPFTLQSAFEYFDLDYTVGLNSEKSKAMELIYYQLEELGNTNRPPEIDNYIPSNTNDIDFRQLPHAPGVYLFRNGEGQIIYVGKAKSIVQRVRSHFTSKLLFERELCNATRTIDYEETGNETIALLLESHYITDLKPKFNTQQKDILDPYIISSKIDSKGILRMQAVQKSYIDSENEFYYNRDSVITKMVEVQQKFNLCKRFNGIERAAGKCGDRVFCKGICDGREKKEEYNLRVKEALQYIEGQRPSYIIKLKGRNAFEFGFVLVKKGIYQGFGFIDAESDINSLADIEGYTKRFAHTYFSSRIIDQYFKMRRSRDESFIRIQ